MEPENLAVEQINEDRRKAIQQNIETISIDDLKALGEKLFPYPTTPEGEVFRFHRAAVSDTCYHATTNDGIEVLYCPATEKGSCWHKGKRDGTIVSQGDCRNEGDRSELMYTKTAGITQSLAKTKLITHFA